MEEEIDTEHTDHPTCPYCEYVDEDDCEMDHSESESESSCNSCGKYYKYSASISVSWNTYKCDCLNGIPHIWSEWKHLWDDEWEKRCEECGKVVWEDRSTKDNKEQEGDE